MKRSYLAFKKDPATPLLWLILGLFILFCFLVMQCFFSYPSQKKFSELSYKRRALLLKQSILIGIFFIPVLMATTGWGRWFIVYRDVCLAYWIAFWGFTDPKIFPNNYFARLPDKKSIYYRLIVFPYKFPLAILFIIVVIMNSVFTIPGCCILRKMNIRNSMAHRFYQLIR